MNKLFHVLNIVFFTVGMTLFIFGSPFVVRADTVSFDPSYRGDDTSNYVSSTSRDWHLCFSGFVESNSRNSHGYQEYLGFGDYRYTYFVNNTSYSFYYVVYGCVTAGGNHGYYILAYSPDNPPITGLSGLGLACYTSDGTSSRNYPNNLLLYPDYYFSQPYYTFFSRSSGDVSFSIGECAFSILVTDYMFPNVDIEDADLDIKGLSAYILNDFQPTIDWTETINNAIEHFNEWAIKNITGLSFYETKNPVNISNPITLAGTVEYVVPGVALSWFSPTLDNDIVYNIWIDGMSDINYKTSIDSFVNFLNQQKVSTVSYGKLKINDSSLTQNPSVYYQYNTAEATEFLLDYIENNSSFSLPDRVDKYNYVSLETKISRVYIQASKVIDGDNHVGALSYIDIVGGVPVVHEGITSIDDVVASDPTTGTPAIVGTTSVVSGDTIYGGDTYFDNSTTNNITGLVVGGGSGLSALAAIKKLFSAIFELVQALYLSNLIKWILVGFTGNPMGNFDL